MNYYVLACETGREERNIRLLINTVRRLLPDCYIQAYSPVRESREFCARKWSMKLRVMLPGYIIVVCDQNLWRIQKDIFLMSETCYGFLKNADGSYELTGTDKAFACWVEENKGYFKPSKIIVDETRLTPDEKITIISGPLKDFEGKILSIYKGVRVTVEVKFLNQVRKITLPVEIVQKISSSEEEPAGQEAVNKDGDNKEYFVSREDY